MHCGSRLILCWRSTFPRRHFNCGYHCCSIRIYALLGKIYSKNIDSNAWLAESQSRSHARIASGVIQIPRIALPAGRVQEAPTRRQPDEDMLDSD